MKNTTSRSTLLASSIALAALAFTACSSQSDTETAADAAQPLDAILLAEAPSGALQIGEARQKAVPGQPIVVTGQIGAAHHPFAESYASFVIADQALDFCNERPGDQCGSPWDACCEPKEKRMALRASVQVLADGTPIEQSLKGVGGLTELDEVIVAGVVDPASTPQNLIINASGIYRSGD